MDVVFAEDEHTLSIYVYCVHRDKEHSTIIYESGDGRQPLLRLGWNKQDPRYMATILMDSSKVGFSCFGALSEAASGQDLCQAGLSDTNTRPRILFGRAKPSFAAAFLLVP